MITPETALQYRNTLRCASHLFDAHSMGVLALNEDNVHDIIDTLRSVANDLDDALVTSQEARS